MALNDTGRSNETETGRNFLATDDEDRSVSVQASHEVLQDYGMPAVWSKAESKYADGNYDDGDNIRIVRVLTSDFAES